jgi:hypothetical protein
MWEKTSSARVMSWSVDSPCSAPGSPGADPVGGQQRLQRTALTQLAGAEAHVDLQPAGLAAATGLDHEAELPQRLGDAELDPLPERALQRPPVEGHLMAQRVDHEVGHLPECAHQQTAEGRRERRPPGVNLLRF